MKQLTETQKSTYVERGGTLCPYCQSENISAWPGLDVEGNQTTQRVSCSDCNEIWVDIYTLSDVEGDDQ